MSTRTTNEGEGPKHFLKNVALPKRVFLFCPVQGREYDYKDGEAYNCFSAAEIDPRDARKMPSYFECVQNATGALIYDAADLYILELLQLLKNKGIRVKEAYRLAQSRNKH